MRSAWGPLTRKKSESRPLTLGSWAATSRSGPQSALVRAEAMGRNAPASRARLLQVADAAQGLGRVGHQHGLQPIAHEGLDRALVGLVGVEGVGHHALRPPGPPGRSGIARTPSSKAECVRTISSSDASRPCRPETSACRPSASRASDSARLRARVARAAAASRSPRSWPRVVSVPSRRASAASRLACAAARSRSSSSHSAASFSRSASARSALPETEPRAFWKEAMRLIRPTWASRAFSWRASASA